MNIELPEPTTTTKALGILIKGSLKIDDSEDTQQ